MYSGRIWNPDRGNGSGFKLPIRLSGFVQHTSALFCPSTLLTLGGSETNLITCVQNEEKLSRVYLSDISLQRRAHHIFGRVPASFIVRVVSNIVSILLKFFFATLELLSRPGIVTDSLFDEETVLNIIYTLRSKFPKVRKCLKWLVFCWRLDVYIWHQQWQNLGNSPITTSRNCFDLNPGDPQPVGKKHCMKCQLRFSTEV